MHYVREELKKIEESMTQYEINSPIWEKLYLVQQTLSWVLMPNMFRSAYDLILNKPIDEPTAPQNNIEPQIQTLTENVSKKTARGKKK